MLKVLIVEDEEMIRKGIVLTVDWSALDCVIVAEAQNGEEGLEYAQRYSPDLIITDIKMPKMDGIEMLTALRESGCTAAAIILSAYDNFPYAQSALRLGACDYILKPFHDGELEAAVSRLKAASPASGSPSALLGNRKGDKSKYVTSTINYLEEHYGNPDLTIADVAEELNISEGHLSHTFKKETNYTFVSYLTRLRVHKAMEMLSDCRVKVYEVAEAVGYRDIAYFSTTFKKQVGMSPSEYQDTCR